MTAGPPWLLFSFCDVQHALPGGALRGVIARPTATRVPGAPAAVIGLVAWRGRVLPLVAVLSVSGEKRSMGVSAALVAVAGGAMVAIATDEVIGWVAEPGSARIVEPATVLEHCRRPAG